MAAYQFDQARLLTYNHVPVSFENGTRYKIQKKLSVQGTLYVAYNDNDVSKTWTKAELLASAADYGEVIINGYSFGVGKITNINFESGNDVEKQDYTFDVECYSQVNALAFGPGLTAAEAALLDKISETVTYEIDGDDNYVFTQSATVRMNLEANGPGGVINASPDPLSLAESVIDALFADSDLFASNIGIDTTLFFNNNLKVLKTRSYSLVDSVCTFSRKLTVPATYSGQGYSTSLVYDVKYQNFGIVTVTEKGTITGVNGGFNGNAYSSGPYLAATAGYDALFPPTSNDTDEPAAAYGRCNQIYSDYQYSQLPLLTRPTTKSATFNAFKGTIEYSVTFTNDPKYVGLGTWIFSNKIEVNDNGDTMVSESGTIVGLGRPYGSGLDNKLSNAKAIFAANVGNGQTGSFVFQRIGPLFQSYEIYKENQTPLFTMTKRSYEEGQLDGTITYSFEYTDVSDYLNFDGNTFVTPDIRRVEIEVTTAMPVAMTQTYNIFNFKQIIQPQNQSTTGSRSVNIKLKGRRGLDIDSYLTAAKSIAADYAPTNVGAATSYIKSANYSCSPNANDFSLTVTWNFVGPNYTFGNTAFSYPS